MVTGIAGSIFAFISYQRVNGIKALDLRLELQKAFNELELALDGLDEFLNYVNQSHERVMAARGLVNSGAMAIWKESFQKDKAKLKALLASAPKREDSYEKLKPSELEARLVSVHKFQLQINELRDKFRSVLESDDEQRREIREDMRNRSIPRMS